MHDRYSPARTQLHSLANYSDYSDYILGLIFDRKNINRKFRKKIYGQESHRKYYIVLYFENYYKDPRLLYVYRKQM
jgi:hypothetical protein